MWTYDKTLQYPINIKRKDLNMAKLLVEQYGGSNGELSAALRYLNQRYTMPDNKGQALLTDIGTEELAHIEMISTMIYQLLKDATIEELKAAGLDSHYAGHKRALYPTNADGVPFTVDYFATTGDPLADLAEDMAAEQKARAVYYIITLVKYFHKKWYNMFLSRNNISKISTFFHIFTISKFH